MCLFPDGAQKLGLHTEMLEATTVKLNWTAFAVFSHVNPGDLTDAYKTKLAAVQGVAWWSGKNPWKYADGFFDKEKFKQKIVNLINKIKVT